MLNIGFVDEFDLVDGRARGRIENFLFRGGVRG
jgi:hypothetical protein